MDDLNERLTVFRLSGGGGVSCGPEAREEIVQQLAKLMADSIFSTDTVGLNTALGVEPYPSSIHQKTHHLCTCKGLFLGVPL